MPPTKNRDVRRLEDRSDVSPPLDLLIETARSIIEYGVLWPEMCNFVEIVSQIELYRVRAVELGHNFKSYGSNGRMPGRQVPDALDDRRHEELRSRYLSMMMFVRHAIIVRRLRLKQVGEAEKAYAMYWPRDISVPQRQLAPFILVVTEMSPDERSDLAAEAVSIRRDMDEIQSWCAGHPSFTDEMFDARFPKLVDKTWVGVAIRWIDDVCNVIKEISDCA